MKKLPPFSVSTFSTQQGVLNFKMLRSFLALGGGSMGQIMKICLKDYVLFLQKETYLGHAKVGLGPLRVKITFVKIYGL